MVIQNATFETQTVGSTLSTGGADGIAASGATALCVASAANPQHGTKHVIVSNPGATTAIIKWTPTASRFVELVLYVRFSTVPTVDFNIVRISDAGDTTTEVQVYLLATSGRIRVATRATTRWTSTSGLAAGTWYRVGIYVDAGTTSSTGAVRCEYFLGDNLTAVEDSTLIGSINVADAIGAAGVVRIGKDTTNVYTGDTYYDSVQIRTVADATQNFAPYSAGAATPQAPMSVLENSGGWTITGGSATQPIALADSSDSTYITSAGAGANETDTFRIDELSDGTVTVTWRARITAGSTATQAKCELLQDTTVIATDTRNASSSPVLSSAFTDFSFTVSSGITDRTKLRVRITGNAS